MRYNRLGRIYLPTDIVKHPFSYQLIFKDLIVLRANEDFARDKIGYIVACEEFDELKEGIMIPEYKATVHHDNSITWENVGSL